MEKESCSEREKTTRGKEDRQGRCRGFAVRSTDHRRRRRCDLGIARQPKTSAAQLALASQLDKMEAVEREVEGEDAASPADEGAPTAGPGCGSERCCRAADPTFHSRSRACSLGPSRASEYGIHVLKEQLG